MTAVTTLPFSRALTYDDLQTMPDDGHRYELVDGVLVVSPSPRTVHQRAVTRLLVVLVGAAPEDVEVLSAPLDVVLADDTVLIPDIVVARRDDYSDRNLPTAPLLAIEVLSPSTRRFDLMLKRSRLESAGCPNYWVVDPDEPGILTWALRDGSYVEVGRATGNDALEMSEPFPVRVVPAELVAARRPRDGAAR
jgi:Uma2 family endonuclease